MYHCNDPLYCTPPRPQNYIHHNIEERVMSSAQQCPNCNRWFTSLGGLRRHLISCDSKNDAEADADANMEQQQHPLQSIHLLNRNDGVDPNNNWLWDNDDIDISTSDDNEVLLTCPTLTRHKRLVQTHLLMRLVVTLMTTHTIVATMTITMLHTPWSRQRHYKYASTNSSTIIKRR